jgi:superfamily II DNA or RNA helicase
MSRRNFTLPANIIPRSYQRNAVNHAKYLLESNPDTWHLFSSPTGTGKSIMELMVLSEVPDSIMITPRLEIIAGMLQKLNDYDPQWNDIQLVKRSWERYGIITPIRLRNILARGEMDFMPSCLIIDESHHSSAETYVDISMYLNGCPRLGFTATPFRGTPKQTQAFHKQWGDTVNQVLSLADAVEMGFYQIPEVTIWPLIDDDTIDVTAGDFKVKHVEKKLQDCYDLIVSNCEAFSALVPNTHTNYGTMVGWDMPTIFAMPETESVRRLHAAFQSANIPTVVVTQETSRSDRIKAFDACIKCEAALIQINVVSEGVDLPIRRVIDCSPTMSPVRWMQQVGRIRPSKGVPPQYICCCRNLERHCYLWEGLLPNAKVAEAQSAFTDENGVPLFSKRSGTRVVGLEGLGRFTTTDIHLNNGTIGFMYSLVHVSGIKRTEYIAFVHPNNPEPVYGIKESAKKEDGTLDWGRWKLVDSLPDLQGCVSAKVNPLTPKQVDRWNASAESKGLDPFREVNTREFQILPFLLNTGLSFRT